MRRRDALTDTETTGHARQFSSERKAIGQVSARKMIFILGMMVFWCNGDNYAAAPLIVEIAKDLHLDISQAAFSVTAYMLPFGLFTLLWQRLWAEGKPVPSGRNTATSSSYLAASSPVSHGLSWVSGIPRYSSRFPWRGLGWASF